MWISTYATEELTVKHTNGKTKNIYSSASALDEILSKWVFWAIFTHPFLIELGIRIFLFGTLFCLWVQEILVFGYLPHKFNLNCFFGNFNWVNTPKSSLSKVQLGINARVQVKYGVPKFQCLEAILYGIWPSFSHERGGIYYNKFGKKQYMEDFFYYRCIFKSKISP